MKKRVIYDDFGNILTVQHWVDETKMPTVGNVKVEDIEELENEVVTDLKVENGQLKFNKKPKEKTYKQKYEEEILKDLINGGVIE